MRWRGRGVPGSVIRHTSSSRVPIEKLVCTSVRAAAAVSTSRSRRISVDLVRIENGLAASPSASMMPRVSRYLPSQRWYGSVLVPIAIGSPCHFGDRSSTRSRSTAFTFTTILRSKSSPMFKPR